jgi:peptide chain release factor 1
LEMILAGDLEEIIQALITSDQAERLKAEIE